MKIFESKIKDSVLLPFLEKTGIICIEIDTQTTIQSLIESNKAESFSPYTWAEILDMPIGSDESFPGVKLIPSHFCEVCGCYPCECSDRDYFEIENTNRQLNEQFYIKK